MENERTLRMCKIIFSEGKVHLYMFDAVEKKSTFEMTIKDSGKNIRKMLKKELMNHIRCEHGRCVVYCEYMNKEQFLIRGAVEYAKHLQAQINQNLSENEIMIAHIETILKKETIEGVKEEEEWVRY